MSARDEPRTAQIARMLGSGLDLSATSVSSVVKFPAAVLPLHLRDSAPSANAWFLWSTARQLLLPLRNESCRNQAKTIDFTLPKAVVRQDIMNPSTLDRGGAGR